MAAWREQEREGKGRVREWRRQGAGPLHVHGKVAEPRGASSLHDLHGLVGHCCSSISNPNSTSKTRLNIHLCPFISPNTFSLGTNGSNNCCRAIWGLQLCLKIFGLTRIILEDRELQSRAHETENSVFSYSDLAKFSDSENSSRFQVWASVWLSSKLIWLLVQKQSLFYSTQTSTFI